MIVCAGELIVDCFNENGKTVKAAGGAPFNVAAGISLLGGEARFYGTVGADENGEFMLSEIAKLPFSKTKIDVIKGHHTTYSEVISENGERSFRFHRDGVDYLLSFGSASLLLDKEPSIIHLGSLCLPFSEGRQFVDDVYGYLSSHPNTRLSFDVNYRDDIFASKEEAIAIYRALVPLFDIVKMSDEEQAVLYPSGYETRPGQLLVLSCGKSGSKAYLERKEYSAPSNPLKPVDTTGAGDAFYSFFLSEVDACGDISKLDVAKALHYANAAGAIATQRVGAISSLPTLDEVKAFADEKRLVL